MRTSCAIMASKVTPPAEDEGVKEDGAEEARESPSRSEAALV